MSKIRIATILLVFMAWSGYMWYWQFMHPVDMTDVLITYEKSLFETIVFFMGGHSTLTEILTNIYLYGFVMVSGGGFLLAYLTKDWVRFDKLLIGLIIIYTIGGLSYSFFYVNPPWNYYPRYTRIHTDAEVNENFYMWTQSGFALPSMHTAISVMMMVTYWRKRYWNLVFGFFGVMIPLATVLLAQHWVIDFVGGVIVSYLAIYIAHEYQPVISEVIRSASHSYHSFKK